MEIKPISMIVKDERIQKMFKKMNELTSILTNLKDRESELCELLEKNGDNHLLINNLQITITIIKAYEQRIEQLEDLVTECCVLILKKNNINSEKYIDLTNELNERIKVALGTIEIEFSSQILQNKRNKQKSIRKN